MSEGRELQKLTTDVALIKQEIHHLRENVKSMQSLFRWGIMAVIAAVITAFMNIILNGDMA